MALSSLSRSMRYALLRSPLAVPAKALRATLHRTEVQERRRLARALPPRPLAKELAEALNRDGHVGLAPIVSAASLTELQAAAQRVLDPGTAQAQATPGRVTDKAFWSRLLDAHMVDGRLPADSPFVRFALQPGIVEVLCAAMGAVPTLDYVLLTLSRPSASLSQSQLWHRDYDDTRTIKVFVYLTDVAGRDDGPFTFMPAQQSDQVGFTLRSHMADEDAFARIAEPRPIEMIAPALSVFAVETSRCLHMGSRVAPGHERLLYTATFTTYPKIVGPEPDRFILSGEETPLERRLLMGSDRAA
jgi:hypothetical protein